VKLLLVRTQEPGPPADVAGGIPATAWTDGHGTIWVRPPFDAKLFPVRRIAHEVEHNLTGQDNSMHHPWWHFCVLVGHALRLWDGHTSKASLKAAPVLLAKGAVDLSTATA